MSLRFELEAARRHGRLVIPLLAQDVKEPEKQKLPPSIPWLMDYQAIPIRLGKFFSDDVARLIGELKPFRLCLRQRYHLYHLLLRGQPVQRRLGEQCSRNLSGD